MKYALILIVIMLLGKCSIAKQYYLHIELCGNKQPVANAFIIGSNGHFLGNTDEIGNCLINVRQFPVYVRKMGFEKLTLYDLSDSNNICLNTVLTHLKEVNITGKRLDPDDYLLKLRDINLPNFVGNDTTIFYHFSYFWEVPGLQWKEQATGYISYTYRNIHSFFSPRVYYVQYQYSSKGKPLNTQFYDSAPVLGADHLLFYNIMSNTGYDLWKRLVNREGRGIRIPVPQFLIEKAVKKASKEASETHDNKMYKYVKRKLILRNIDGNQIFTTFSTNDTNSKNILEKVVFDKDNNLHSVEYFTPEQISGDIPISEKIRENERSFSRINSDSSYYYSKYIYSNEVPRMLKSATHIGIAVEKNIYFRSKIEINLVDSIPTEQFRIPIYDTKGKQVLSDIKNYQGDKTNDDEVEKNIDNNGLIKQAIKTAEQTDK